MLLLFNLIVCYVTWKVLKGNRSFQKIFMCMIIKGRSITQASKCIFVRYMGRHYWHNWLTRYCIARMNLYGALIIISLRLNTLWSSFLPPGSKFLVQPDQLNSVMEKCGTWPEIDWNHTWWWGKSFLWLIS